jgi:hypothetical protein
MRERDDDRGTCSRKLRELNISNYQFNPQSHDLVTVTRQCQLVTSHMPVTCNANWTLSLALDSSHLQHVPVMATGGGVSRWPAERPAIHLHQVVLLSRTRDFLYEITCLPDHWILPLWIMFTFSNQLETYSCRLQGHADPKWGAEGVRRRDGSRTAQGRPPCSTRKATIKMQ